MTLLMAIVVLGLACVLSLVYLCGTDAGRGASRLVLGGHRPWRRVGAGICLLIAVMYVIGVDRLSADASPKTYTLYWLTILILVVWLCLLAIKDILHTRRTLSRWRAGSANLDGTPTRRKQEPDEEP